MEFLVHNWVLVVLAIVGIGLLVFGPAMLRRYRAYSIYQAGAAYMRARQPEKAVEAYRESIQLWPGYFGAYNNLGVALAELGKHDEALAVYQEAVRLHPEHGPAYNNIGVAYYRTGHYAEAAEAIEKAIALRPAEHAEQVRLHFNLGLAYLAAGDEAKAREAYRQALAQAQPEELVDARSGLNELLQTLPQRPAWAAEMEQLLSATQAREPELSRSVS